MLADHFAVIDSFEIKAIALLDIDVEVIAPKLDHDLIQLPFAVQLTDQRGLAQLIRNCIAVIAVEEAVADAFELVRIHLEGFEWAELNLTGEIVDRFEIQLLLDPCL